LTGITKFEFKMVGFKIRQIRHIFSKQFQFFPMKLSIAIKIMSK